MVREEESLAALTTRGDVLYGSFFRVRGGYVVMRPEPIVAMGMLKLRSGVMARRAWSSCKGAHLAPWARRFDA